MSADGKKTRSCNIWQLLLLRCRKVEPFFHGQVDQLWRSSFVATHRQDASTSKPWVSEPNPRGAQKKDTLLVYSCSSCIGSSWSKILEDYSNSLFIPFIIYIYIYKTKNSWKKVRNQLFSTLGFVHSDLVSCEKGKTQQDVLGSCNIVTLDMQSCCRTGTHVRYLKCTNEWLNTNNSTHLHDWLVWIQHTCSGCCVITIAERESYISFNFWPWRLQIVGCIQLHSAIFSYMTDHWLPPPHWWNALNGSS